MSSEPLLAVRRLIADCMSDDLTAREYARSAFQQEYVPHMREDPHVLSLSVWAVLPLRSQSRQSTPRRQTSPGSAVPMAARSGKKRS